MMQSALALIPLAAGHTPDTRGFMALGYGAIGIILLGYLLSLWLRIRRAKTPPGDDRK